MFEQKFSIKESLNLFLLFSSLQSYIFYLTYITKNQIMQFYIDCLNWFIVNNCHSRFKQGCIFCRFILNIWEIKVKFLVCDLKKKTDFLQAFPFKSCCFYTYNQYCIYSLMIFSNCTFKYLAIMLWDIVSL